MPGPMHDRWRAAVLSEVERVRGLVAADRSGALPDGCAPREGVDAVAAAVFAQLHANFSLLDGREEGELRMFTRTAAVLACDEVAAAVDGGVPERTGGCVAFDAVGPAAVASLRDLARRLAADDADAEVLRFTVHPALGRIDSELRIILVMDQAWIPTDAIVERIEEPREAVLRRRREGYEQLGESIRDLDGDASSAAGAGDGDGAPWPVVGAAGRAEAELLLDAYVAAWQSGAAPNLAAWAGRVAPADREAVAQLLAAFLQIAPTITPTGERARELSTDPLVDELLALPG
ncbi:MAG: hypothetical protein PGN13_00425 [Patulibacter minatonensis]